MSPQRSLRLVARAARMANTRQRIISAAYQLHCTVGPARTTISAVADRAGVQRHTVYQHFPDELTLGGACTAYGLALDPQPDPRELVSIADPEERLRAALSRQYGYYRRNEGLMANVTRDSPLLRERLEAAGRDRNAVPRVVREFFAQPIRVGEVLVAGWPSKGAQLALLRATVHLAIDFGTWRSLVRAQRLSQRQAVELMVTLVTCATARRRHATR